MLRPDIVACLRQCPLDRKPQPRPAATPGGLRGAILTRMDKQLAPVPSAVILVRKRRLPREREPGSEVIYDTGLQIWVTTDKHEPVVTRKRAARCSKFGETSLTETGEGADQSEGTGLTGSEFGETVLTKTSEGHDQCEVLVASEFGETTKTATAEGSDQTEIAEFDASNVCPTCGSHR